MMDAMKSFSAPSHWNIWIFSSRNALFFVYSVSHVKIIDAKINYSCLHVIISCLYLGMCYLNSMFWSFEKQHARSVCLDVMFVLYPRQRLLACSKILRFLLFVISGRETNCPSPRSCAALWPNSCCEGEQSAVINHPRNSCLSHLQSLCWLLFPFGGCWQVLGAVLKPHCFLFSDVYVFQQKTCQNMCRSLGICMCACPDACLCFLPCLDAQAKLEKTLKKSLRKA